MVGEMEREDGEWEAVRLALTHATHRTQHIGHMGGEAGICGRHVII